MSTVTELILGGFGRAIAAATQDWPPKTHQIARLTKDQHNEFEVARARESEEPVMAPTKDLHRE